MSDRCPKCHAREGRCDCRDTDPELLADRIADMEARIERLEDQVDGLLRRETPGSPD